VATSPADQNEDSGRERQDSHDDGRDDDAGNKRHEADQNEVNREQKQTEIFLEVHDVCLSLGDDVAKPGTSRAATC
jgi:hypothetical protein